MNKTPDRSIMIKPSHKGKFAEHCKKEGYEGVTQECITDAKNSKSDKLKKQAVFAENSRKWKD